MILYNIIMISNNELAKDIKYYLQESKYSEINKALTEYYKNDDLIFSNYDFFKCLVYIDLKKQIHITNKNFLESIQPITTLSKTKLTSYLTSFQIKKMNYDENFRNFNKIFSFENTVFPKLVSITLNNCINTSQMVKNIFTPNNKFYYLNIINLKYSDINIHDIKRIETHFILYNGFIKYSFDDDEDTISIIIIVSDPKLFYKCKTNIKYFVIDVYGKTDYKYLEIKTHFEN